MPETDKALQEMKMYLTLLPIMVAPELGDPLLLYMVVTSWVISVALVVEREEEIPRPERSPAPEQLREPKRSPSGEKRCVQQPVYFISKVLLDAETHYTDIQKLYVILIASRKLHRHLNLT